MQIANAVILPHLIGMLSGLIPSPRLFAEALEATFSGSRFMRICMPPLLLFAAALILPIGIAEFWNGRGTFAASCMVAWGVVLLLAIPAAIFPVRTSWLRGLIASFLGTFFIALPIGLWVNDSGEVFGLLVVSAWSLLLAFGAFSYALLCFQKRSSQQDPSAEE